MNLPTSQAKACCLADDLDEVTPTAPTVNDFLMIVDDVPHLKRPSNTGQVFCDHLGYIDLEKLEDSASVKFCFVFEHGKNRLSHDGTTWKRRGPKGALYWMPGDPDTTCEDPVAFLNEHDDSYYDKSLVYEFQAYTWTDAIEFRLAYVDGRWMFIQVALN